jgi:hypothetical protein
MTPLTPSRVPLLLEKTKVTKPACSAAKIRGRTGFCHGEAPDWVFWSASAKVSSGKFRSIDFIFDRSTSGKIRSIDFKFDRLSFFRTSEFSKQFLMNFAIPHLLTYKT